MYEGKMRVPWVFPNGHAEHRSLRPVIVCFDSLCPKSCRDGSSRVESEASSAMRALSDAHCLHITNKDRYQNNERPRTLALLNSPQY